MSFTHRFVNRSWITYEVDKDGSITTILNVEPTMPVYKTSELEGDIANAIVEYMTEHNYIDRAVVVPRNIG